MQKLSNFGLDGVFLKLFFSYLQNRVHRARVRNSVSSAKTVAVVFTQGSILIPRQFLVYFTGSPEHIKSSVNLSADDSRILSTVPNEFIADIGYFTDWSNSNKLNINLQKCQYYVDLKSDAVIIN